MADSPVNGDLRGAIVMAGFSLVWFLWPALAAPFGLVHRLSWVLGALSLSAVLFARRTLAAIHVTQPEAGRGNPFRYPAYRRAVAFEVVGVIGAAMALERRPATAAYFPTALALIVGLHFLAWWRRSARESTPSSAPPCVSAACQRSPRIRSPHARRSLLWDAG